MDPTNESLLPHSGGAEDSCSSATAIQLPGLASVAKLCDELVGGVDSTTCDDEVPSGHSSENGTSPKARRGSSTRRKRVLSEPETRSILVSIPP
jgi:hypothetical protein